MPTPTYDLISSTTFTTTTISVFVASSLNYRDLVFVLSTRSTTTGSSTDDLRVFFEFDESSLNKNYVTMTGNGSTATSEAQTNQQYILIKGIRTSASSNTDNSFIILNLLDFKTSDKHRTLLWRKNDANGVAAGVGRQAITTAGNYFITFASAAANLASGSRLDIYGIVS